MYLFCKKEATNWWFFFLNIYSMRYLKMFEEFSEIEQLVMAMFEDANITPERVNIPSNELMYVYSYDENVNFDTKRFEQMFSEIGWGLHFDHSGGHELVRYCIVYNKKIMDTILNYKTLDEAVYVIQTEVGQTDGGIAGHFFADDYDDETGDYLSGDDIWNYFKIRRFNMIMEYIIFEIYNISSDL
jgi:hypothetical protein